MSLSDGLGIVIDPIKKKPTDDVGAISPMVISGVSVSVGGGSATVSWVTNVGGSSQVRYGVYPNLDMETMEDVGLVTSHSVQLSGLVSGRVYLFEVRSRYGGGKDGGDRAVMDGYVFRADGSFVA